MNIEEIDKWLDTEYGCSYTKLEELHNYWFEKSTDQKLEIERLKNVYEKNLQLVDKLYLKDKEIERLNNIINEKDKEIEDYSNKWCELAKAKTKSDNIINELEKWVKSEYDRYYNDKENLVFSNVEVIDFGRVLDKLQELKGSDKG